MCTLGFIRIYTYAIYYIKKKRLVNIIRFAIPKNRFCKPCAILHCFLPKYRASPIKIEGSNVSPTLHSTTRNWLNTTATKHWVFLAYNNHMNTVK